MYIHLHNWKLFFRMTYALHMSPHRRYVYPDQMFLQAKAKEIINAFGLAKARLFGCIFLKIGY